MGGSEEETGQFHPSKFLLEHDSPSDFYICCWQRNQKSLPMLCIRTFLFLGCLAILIASLILTGMSMNVGYWFIYLTHWGLCAITVTSGLAFAVSLRVYLKGPFGFRLPFFVKLYWAMYEIAIPMAFFITGYYYILLLNLFEDFAINPVLDFFIHGMNSILMLGLLLTCRQPPRLLHFIYPLCFGIVYVIFSVIYYFAGGTDIYGNVYIYPMLDWSNPGPTVIMVAVTALTLVVMHVIVVGITALRDFTMRRCRSDSKTGHISNANIAYS